MGYKKICNRHRHKWLHKKVDIEECSHCKKVVEMGFSNNLKKSIVVVVIVNFRDWDCKSIIVGTILLIIVII